MIVLWGHSGERPLEMVRSALGDLRADVVVFDQRVAADWSIELTTTKHVEGRLVGPGRAIDLSEVTAVYTRPYDPAATAHGFALYDAFRVWTEITPARVVNRLSAMGSNSSKPYQSALIERAGLSTPTTLVTTDPEAAKAFVAKHGEVIYKSVGSVRSIVARVTAADADRLDAIRWCPTQFQVYVAGADVRVHVVDGAAFACEVSSSATDYRYPGHANVTRTRTDVPKDVAEKCVALTKSLGLVVAGIDLRRTASGWVCFEANPSPAFSYFDLDGSIAAAIAKYLGGKS